MVVTFDHVTVLCDGVFVDYPNISKPRELVYEVFEFSNFAHHDEIRSKIHKKEDTKVGWWFIVVVILVIGLFDQRDKVERDLIKLKIWIKKEIFKN